jgi:beta-galactosidase
MQAAETASCGRMATSRSADAIPRPASAGTGASSIFRPAISGRRIWIEFDGAFRDVQVFVNGCYIGNNDNGYAPFRFDLTDFLTYGAKNYIAAARRCPFGDGWFYEGAGIYRHVWLSKMDALHLGRWESTVRSSLSGDSATLTLDTVVENEGKQG